MSIYISTPDYRFPQKNPATHKNYISVEYKQYSFAVSLELNSEYTQLFLILDTGHES